MREIKEIVILLEKHYSFIIQKWYETFVSGKDELDRIILKQSLVIRNVFFDKSLDLMLVILNNSKIIKRKISEFKELCEVTSTELMDFKNDGEGIHWIGLDYDLSLKGLLEHELIFVDRPF